MRISIRVVEPGNTSEPPKFAEFDKATWLELRGAKLYINQKQYEIVEASEVAPADFIVRVEPVK